MMTTLSFFSVSLILLLLIFVQTEGKRKYNSRVKTAEEYSQFYENFDVKSGSLFAQDFYGETPADFYYVGKNKQNVQSFGIFVSLETGFNKFWAFDKSFPTLNHSIQFPYDVEKSTTGQKLNTHSEGKTGLYNISGNNYIDIVNNGEGPYNVTFGSIDKAIGPNGRVPHYYVSGIVGYGWDPKESKTQLTSTSSPILHELKNQRKKRVEIWQYREVNSTAKQIKFREDICVGCNDLAQDGYCATKITYIPLKSDNKGNLLTFKVNAFQIGKYSFKKDLNGKADTGLAVMYLPPIAYKSVIKTLNAQFDDSLQIYTTDCSNQNTYPNLIYTIEGNQFSLQAKYYVVDMFLPNGQCVVALDVADNLFYIDYAFGQPFLRQYCQFLDVANDKIGFSQALKNGNE